MLYLEFNAHVESDGVSVCAGILNFLQFVTKPKVHGLDKSNRDSYTNSRCKIETINFTSSVANFSIDKRFDASAPQRNIHTYIGVNRH